MILPTKEVAPSKALLTVGADVLRLIGDSSVTVSGLWRHVADSRGSSSGRISYDWYILALDLLFALNAVELTPLGLVRRVRS